MTLVRFLKRLAAAATGVADGTSEAPVMRTYTVFAGAFCAALVFGQIRDLTTGQPLPNVTVSIGSHHAATDAQGRYRLSGIAPGDYTLKAESDDVPATTHQVHVSGTQTKADLRVCSTTLDYGCGGSGPG